jgi:hypothetical protein
MKKRDEGHGYAFFSFCRFISAQQPLHLFPILLSP